jgi:hypothetical protein
MWDLFWSMGDVNRDGYIDGTDIGIITANYGWHGPPGGNIADINSDGVVNLKDMNICVANQGLDFWTYFGNPEVTWYHVDIITLTLLVSDPLNPGTTMYIEYRIPYEQPFETMYAVKTDPVGSPWHEVYPDYYQAYQIVDWSDNCNGVLSYCDTLTLLDLQTQFTSVWHVEKLSIDLILNKKITDPVCTYWNELHPEYGNVYHIIGWEDNGDNLLSPSDSVYLDPGAILPYHVETVTLTLLVSDVSNPSTTMYIEFEGSFEEMYSVKTTPGGSHWHEVYPVFCPLYYIVGWWDTYPIGNNILGYGDMLNLYNVDTQGVTDWYVEELAIDITVELPVHDVAVTYGASRYSWVYQGLVDPIDVTVVNQGDFTETVDVYAFYDSNLAAPKQTVVLNPGETASLMFSWLTKGRPIGFYTISANATIAVDDDSIDNVLVGNKEQVVLPPSLFWKEAFRDYAPSGMPDFDQRQDAWASGPWTWCAPTAVANSLWWYDSKYESNPIPPPAMIDNYPLVTSYNPGVWDDHDPQNVQPLIVHLAYLMDTDGQRTVPGGGAAHSGTWVWDMQAGIAHYLSWTGVNPLGDVNGDGKVDMTDASIVIAAMGKTPGMAGWDMRADIFPATLGWPAPSPADNIIDPNDLALVMGNIGATGTFHETTVRAPEFQYVDEEIEKSEDVALVLGFWFWDGTKWTRENYPYNNGSGHCVTAAGVNSTTWQIALSDPIQDNAEPLPHGTNGAGRVYPPSPHPHPPVPPETVHNDASFVSHDIYNAAPLPPNFPAGIASFGLVNYASPQYPGQPLAVAEWAVIVSPLGVHDVAVTNITPIRTVVADNCSRAGHVHTYNVRVANVTVENQGDFSETFNVALYASNVTDLLIGTQLVTLASHTNTTLTFKWNTASLGMADHKFYTLKAVADTVTDEVDTLDNTLINGKIRLVLPGNANGDKIVNYIDIYTEGIVRFMKTEGETGYTYNADMNDDGIVNYQDIYTSILHFMDPEP